MKNTLEHETNPGQPKSFLTITFWKNLAISACIALVLCFSALIYLNTNNQQTDYVLSISTPSTPQPETAAPTLDELILYLRHNRLTPFIIDIDQISAEKNGEQKIKLLASIPHFGPGKSFDDSTPGLLWVTAAQDGPISGITLALQIPPKPKSTAKPSSTPSQSTTIPTTDKPDSGDYNAVIKALTAFNQNTLESILRALDSGYNVLTAANYNKINSALEKSYSGEGFEKKYLPYTISMIQSKLDGDDIVFIKITIQK